jgi:hypothetical protein
LKGAKNTIVQIIAMDGTVISKTNPVIAGETLEIDVRFLPPGVYMLSLVAGEKTVMRKFVKE